MKEFLSTFELSEMIGRSPAAIRNMVSRRMIPFRKRGKLIFVRSEIEAWIKEAPGISLEEIQNERR